MCQTHYIPSGPYIFSEKSKYPNKSVGQLLFEGKYKYIKYLLECKIKIVCKNKDELHLYLEWFFKQLKMATAKSFCPHCKKNHIQYIAQHHVPGDSIIDLSQRACDNEECKKKVLSSDKSISLVKLSPKNMSILSKNLSLKYFVEFLKDEFKVPKKKRKEDIFKWVQNLKILPPRRLEGEQWVIDF